VSGVDPAELRARLSIAASTPRVDVAVERVVETDALEATLRVDLPDVRLAHLDLDAPPALVG